MSWTQLLCGCVTSWIQICPSSIAIPSLPVASIIMTKIRNQHSLNQLASATCALSFVCWTVEWKYVESCSMQLQGYLYLALSWTPVRSMFPALGSGIKCFSVSELLFFLQEMLQNSLLLIGLQSSGYQTALSWPLTDCVSDSNCYVNFCVLETSVVLVMKFQAVSFTANNIFCNYVDVQFWKVCQLSNCPTGGFIRRQLGCRARTHFTMMEERVVLWSGVPIKLKAATPWQCLRRAMRKSSIALFLSSAF